MSTFLTIRKPAQVDFPGFEIHADDTVVDVGCGDGPVCVYAGSRGAEVIGLDIEPALIDRTAQAMKSVNARSFRGIVGDANPIPLPDNTASVVIATEILEHVDDPAVILAELFRIGRPGARYVISVPDPASESIMKCLAPPWYFQHPVHVRIFEHEVLDRYCAEAGLEIEGRHSSGFYFSMFWMLNMALGMEHKYAETPDHPAFEQLRGVLETVLAAPGGPEAIRTLDRLIPKSQVIVARKPVAVEPSENHPTDLTSSDGRVWSVHEPEKAVGRPFGKAIRQALKDGSIRVGGYSLRWNIRKAVG